jgi:hypothetical protein
MEFLTAENFETTEHFETTRNTRIDSTIFDNSAQKACEEGLVIKDWPCHGCSKVYLRMDPSRGGWYCGGRMSDVDHEKQLI